LLIAPEYAGAGKNRFALVPTISYRNSNGFFAGSGQGLGYQTKVDQFLLSAALAYRSGRNDDSGSGLRRGSDDLRGMGDIPDAFTARLQGSYLFDGGVKLGLKSELALNHRETGNTWGLDLSVPLFSSKTDQFGLNLSTTYGDRKYNQSNFGVSSQQSLGSGYRTFNADAGFNNVSTSLSWRHTIDKNWSIATQAGITQVVGNAADSPIVKKKTNGLLATSINYSF
jgi:outer membrane scaffolding protein for murein synthesis (MipA/OmpV family)